MCEQLIIHFLLRRFNSDHKNSLRDFFLSVASKFEGISFLTYSMIPPPLLPWSNRQGVLSPSKKKLSSGKLLSIIVSEIIKTSTLPFTWVERKSILFLMEFMLTWVKISLLELSLRNGFKTLTESFACVTFDTWDLHSLRYSLKYYQLKRWDSCLINIPFHSSDPFLFKWSLPLFKWLDLNFCIVCQIQISVFAKIFPIAN